MQDAPALVHQSSTVPRRVVVLLAFLTVIITLSTLKPTTFAYQGRIIHPLVQSIREEALREFDRREPGVRTTLAPSTIEISEQIWSAWEESLMKQSRVFDWMVLVHYRLEYQDEKRGLSSCLSEWVGFLGVFVNIQDGCEIEGRLAKGGV